MLVLGISALCFSESIPVGRDRRSEGFRVGRDRWSIQFVRQPTDQDDHDEAEDSIQIQKNGRRLLKIKAGDLNGMYIQAAHLYYPVPWPTLGLSGHSGAGHGETNRFYGIRNGRLFLMLDFYGEHGGPIFRDFDKDGVMEWVFDNFDWYEQYDAGPNKFLVYKLQRDGKMKLWKKFANPKHEYLPMPKYRYF